MSTTALPPAIFLMGPTAAGKTALALALAERFPVEIISVDSSQVYRGMDIGTAKPTPDELARAPNHLIDIREPWQPYSAAEFCADARRLMDEITARGCIPLLAGGTMFYFHSLEFGLSRMPSADPEIRQRLEQEAAEQGWAALHARLVELDPASGTRIHANDTQRIQRALEIIELTGQTPSELGETDTRAPQLPYELIRLALWPGDREALRARIATRFHQMLEQGLLDEVDALLKLPDMDPRLPSMRMVGYRQAIRYLSGEVDRETMTELGITATRQLAKRQLTWLRSYPGVDRTDCIVPGMVDRGIDYFASRLTKKGI